jgi:hypothetical protein
VLIITSAVLTEQNVFCWNGISNVCVVDNISRAITNVRLEIICDYFVSKYALEYVIDSHRRPTSTQYKFFCTNISGQNFAVTCYCDSGGYPILQHWQEYLCCIMPCYRLVT